MATQHLHASCVKIAGQGLLIMGAAGRGKSTLALGLISHGGRLIADDQIVLHDAGDCLYATRPAGLPALIEARGIGLLHAPMARSARIGFAVDMDRDEVERLPPARQITILGHVIPLLYRGSCISFAVFIAHMMRHGRSVP